jgi:hypothetical protein
MNTLKVSALVGLLSFSVLALGAGNAVALSLSGGSFTTKGVACTGTGNTQGAVTAGNCGVANDPNSEILVICRNAGGNISTGEAFLSSIQFNAAQAAVTTIDKKGNVSFTAITNATGVHPETGFTGAQCQADPACAALQQFCPNPNWVPVDVVPIKFTAELDLYYCDNDNVHTCPCNPTLDADPNTGGPTSATSGPVNRCATATSSKTTPTTWSFVWSDTNGDGVINHLDILPGATGKFSCNLPNSSVKKYVYGSSVPYDCTQQ